MRTMLAAGWLLGLAGAALADGAAATDGSDLKLLLGAPVGGAALLFGLYRVVVLPFLDRWAAMQKDRADWERERMDKSAKLQEGHQTLTLGLTEAMNTCRELVRECRELHKANAAAVSDRPT